MMKREVNRDFEVRYDDTSRSIVLSIGHMIDSEWPSYMQALERIEQFIIDNDDIRLDVQCHMVGNTSTLYVMHVLKMAERYQWLGEKKIQVNCDLGLGKSHRFWLKEKLLRCFELDIRFTSMLAHGTCAENTAIMNESDREE